MGKLLELQNPFDKFRKEQQKGSGEEKEKPEEEKKEEKKEEDKKEEKKEEKKGKGRKKGDEKYIEKLKEIPFGKGTSLLIDYLGRRVIQDERYVMTPLKVI